MKLTKLSLIAAIAMTTTFSAQASEVEVSANVALTSNYVWRGITQTSNSPAIQGGIDLGYGNFYLGTWLSNVSAGVDNVEVDYYAGYASTVSGLDYDLGYISYQYPESGSETDEVYLGLSKDLGGFTVSGTYSVALDDAANTDYWEAGISTEAMGLGLSASYGDYDTVGTNYLISASKEVGKFEVSLAYTNFKAEVGTDEEDHVVATISTSF